MEQQLISNDEQNNDISQTINEKMCKFNGYPFNQKIEILDYFIKTITNVKDTQDPILDIKWNYIDWLSISNPQAIEKALEFLNIYVKQVQSGKYEVPEMITNVVNKTSSYKKQDISQLRFDLIVFHMEKYILPTMQGLEESLKNSNPKTLQIGLDIVQKVFLKFKDSVDSQVFSNLLTTMKQLLINANNDVRDSALQYCAMLAFYKNQEIVADILPSLKKQQLIQFNKEILHLQNQGQNLDQNKILNQEKQQDKQNQQQQQDTQKQEASQQAESVTEEEKVENQIKQKKKQQIIQKKKEIEELKAKDLACWKQYKQQLQEQQIKEQYFNFDDIPVKQGKQYIEIDKYNKQKPEKVNIVLKQKIFNKEDLQNFNQEDYEEIWQKFNYKIPTQLNDQSNLLLILTEKFKTAQPNDMFLKYYWNFESWLTRPVVQIIEKTLLCLQIFAEKVKKVPGYFTVIVDYIIKLQCFSRNQTLIVIHNTVNLLFSKGYKPEIFEAIGQNLQPNIFDKFVCNAINLIIDLLQNWGLKNMESLQPFYSKIEKLTTTSSPKIRTATMEFYTEAYKWMGESLKMQLNNVRGIQTKELTKVFNELAQKMQIMVPKRCPQDSYIPFISLVQNNNGANQVGSLNNNNEEEKVGFVSEENKSDEAYQQQQDMLKKNQVQDKKEYLDKLVSDAWCAQQISQDPGYQRNIMIQKLKILLNDSNSLIVVQTMRVCGDLALKLGKIVREMAQELAPLFFEKFKDKFISNEEVLRALICFRKAMKFERIKDVVKQGLVSQDYIVRLNSILLIERYLELDAKKKYGWIMLEYNQQFEQLCQEKDREIQVLVLNVIGKILFLYGDQTVEKVLVNLNKRQIKHINQNFEKFELIYEHRKKKEEQDLEIQKQMDQQKQHQQELHQLIQQQKMEYQKNKLNQQNKLEIEANTPQGDNNEIDEI